MKDYIVYFTDGTDTTGKARNKTEMRRQANRYIRAWQLDCRVLRIEEANSLTDKEVEEIWDDLTDVPFNEDADGNLALAED